MLSQPFRLRDLVLFDFLARLDVPSVCERLIAYTMAVSASIGVVNLAPGVRLDGREMLKSVVETWKGRRGGKIEAMARGRCFGEEWTVKAITALLLLSVASSAARAGMGR